LLAPSIIAAIVADLSGEIEFPSHQIMKTPGNPLETGGFATLAKMRLGDFIFGKRPVKTARKRG
jgi:hypothetical protein